MLYINNDSILTEICRKITSTVESEEGVLKCEVRLEEKNADIEYDPDNVSPEKLVNIINNIGTKVCNSFFLQKLDH